MSATVMQLPSAAAAMDSSSTAAMTAAHRLVATVRMHLRYLASIDMTQPRVLFRPMVDLVTHLGLAGRAVDVGRPLHIRPRRRVASVPGRALDVRTGPCPIATGSVLKAVQRALADVVGLDLPV